MYFYVIELVGISTIENIKSVEVAALLVLD